MESIILELLIPVLVTLITALIGVFGAKLTAVISKKKGLETVAAATQEAINMAVITAGELQQTMVEGFKAAHADKKLSKEEIRTIGNQLLLKTQAKMSQPAKNVLAAANVDLNALIIGAAEDAILSIKQS
jgi:hypothetical protein